MRKIGLERVIEREVNLVQEFEREVMEERGRGEAKNLRERSLEEEDEEEIAERRRGVVDGDDDDDDDERRMREREEREGC